MCFEILGILQMQTTTHPVGIGSLRGPTVGVQGVEK